MLCLSSWDGPCKQDCQVLTLAGDTNPQVISKSASPGAGKYGVGKLEQAFGIQRI